MNREEQLAEAFVTLANTLADDFDPVVLLQRLTRHCVEIIGADAAGVMMATVRGDLRTMAVSDDGAAFLELIQMQTGQGPCPDCYHTAGEVEALDLTAATDRWPRFAPAAVSAGYHAAQALPLRANHQVIGALNLFRTAPGGLSPADLRLAQALADVAAVALIHWNPDRIRPSDILTRLQSTAAAKAAIETATGMLAEYGRLDLAEAGSALRAYSRHNGGRLTDTAHALIRRSLAPDTVLAAQP
ncbi:GAF domain-containing protein [Streptomyces violascens]|uniref:GAF domain-containing protein n=1 Tax=Streptomyces violascens TaxID=67381 RepID=UPI0036C504D7